MASPMSGYSDNDAVFIPSKYHGPRETRICAVPDQASRAGLAAHYGLRAYKQALIGNAQNAVAFARAAAHHGLELVGRTLLGRAGGRKGNEGQVMDGECSCELL